MRKQPWSNENKTERINFTIEPSLKEAFLKIISTDVSTYFRSVIEKEVEGHQKKLKTGRMPLRIYCMDNLRRSPSKYLEHLITEDETILIRFWMLCPLKKANHWKSLTMKMDWFMLK